MISRNLTKIGGLALLLFSPLAADDTLDREIREALADFNALMERIATEKSPLLEEINRLELGNLALRDQVQELEAVNRRSRDEVTENQKKLERTQNEFSFVERILEEYLVNFESRLQIAEDQRFKETLSQLRAEPDDGLTRYFKAIELGLERQRELVGGYRFHGRAIDASGNIASGTIGILGPVAYFHQSDGNQGGILGFNPGTIEPRLIPLTEAQRLQVRNLLANGSGPTPLDSSEGEAIAIAQANVTLVQHVQKGGEVGYFILFLGGVALLLSLVKLSDFSGFRSVDSPTITSIARKAQQGEADLALLELEKTKGQVEHMLRIGIENVDAEAALLEDMMLSAILRYRSRLERFLPFLAITAAAAPLLGLLGTVVGMIKTFALITVFGTGDPQALSAGISEALITTELGLIVAIPALLIHALYSRLIKSRVGLMEQIAFDFVSALAKRKNP